MAGIIDILTFTTDPQLESELNAACASLGDNQPRMRYARSRNELMESIRSRPPALVLMPFGDDPRDVSKLASELATSSPPIPLAAVFRPNGFRDNVSESTVIIESMRAGVRDFLRRPISTNELRTLVDDLNSGTSRKPASSHTASGQVVTFISNKGGVGKSTLSVNTAVGLALRHPGRVLLIDASLQMGVAAALLDLQTASTLTDVVLERDRLDVTMIRQMAIQHSSGLHLLAAPTDAIEAMEVDDTLMARVITLARQAYDYVIIDTFPMFDRVIVAALDLSDRAYIVMENVVPTLLGAVKLLSVLERIGFPSSRQSLILNRVQRMPGNLAIDDISARLGRPIDHVLPFDKNVIAAANSGEPIGAKTFRFGKFSRGLQRLVQEIDSMEGHAAEAGSAKPTSQSEQTHVSMPVSNRFIAGDATS